MRTVSNLPPIPLQSKEAFVGLNIGFQTRIHIEVLLFLPQFTKELIPDFFPGRLVQFVVFNDEMNAAEDSVIDVA